MNNPNLIELTGTIKRDLEERTDKTGQTYYFTFLQREYEQDLPIFLWSPNYSLAQQAEKELIENTEVTLFGKWNKDRSAFHLTEWKLEGLEVF